MTYKLSDLAHHWLDGKSIHDRGPNAVSELPSSETNPPPSVPVELTTLKVTKEDIFWAVQTGLKRPILLTLQRVTGTLWRIYDDGFAIEVMQPHRACILPEAALQEALDSNSDHELLDTTWEVPLFPTYERDGHSVIQRRELPNALRDQLHRN